MKTTAATASLETIEYPDLSERVQSTFIDAIFIVLMMFCCASMLDRYENAPDWIRIVLFFGLWAVYEPLCTSLGCTIGNLVKGIRVRSQNEVTKKINILQALLRYIIKCILGWVSFVTIHGNPQRRAIHDLVAGSVMIRK